MIVAGIIAGCAHVNDPFKDAGAAVEPEMTTPTADSYRGTRTEALPLRRTWASSDVRFANGTVTHWPLWFEDPFEDKGNACPSPDDRDAPDTAFALNAVDFLHVGYGPARMFLNTVGWPVSAVVTPPGTLMESDGRISRGGLGFDHDAKRADPARRPPVDEAPIRSGPVEAATSAP